MKRLTIITFAALAAIGCAQETRTEANIETKTETQPAVPAAVAADGIVTIKVGAEFQPAVINAKAGQPLTLRFDRTSGEPNCGDEVVFKSLNQTHKLPDKQITEVKLAPQESGELQFACGMNMMKGKIVVQ